MEVGFLRKKEEKSLQEPKCCRGTELGPQRETHPTVKPLEGVSVKPGQTPSVIFAEVLGTKRSPSWQESKEAHGEPRHGGSLSSTALSLAWGGPVLVRIALF